MTTIQLALRLANRGELRDLGLLPYSDLTTLMDAMNAGISEYYDLAPDVYSQTTISTILPAPISTSVEVLNGSHELTQESFLSEQRGATVRIGDDPGFNEVATRNTVLDAYRGTSGEQNAIVYGDAVALLGSEFIRISGNPRLDNGMELLRNDSLRERRFRGRRGVGTPQFYFSEPVGQAQGGREVVIFRVDPMPSREFTVRMEAIVTPFTVGYEDFTTPRELPIPARMIQRGLIPLCLFHLRGSVFWKGDKNTASDAEAARRAVADLPAHLARPRSKTRTPKGW